METSNNLSVTERLLFASDEELEEASILPAQRQRIKRLRTMYSWWVSNPHVRDADVVAEIRRREGIGRSVAYADVKEVKMLIGRIHEASQQYDRWLFRQRLEEGFVMARRKGDARAFAALVAAMGKYAKLDKEIDAAPDYSEIVPEPFEISTDATLAGFKRIPDLDQRIARLTAQFRLDAPKAEEAEPLPQKTHTTENEARHEQ